MVGTRRKSLAHQTVECGCACFARPPFANIVGLARLESLSPKTRLCSCRNDHHTAPATSGMATADVASELQGQPQ